ncbi:2'-5' RNA ligase family protein [Herbiconiux sp. CPCC 203407]|uniref:2'-5' RNA ligase family protein n=1 Tax=Herbiconiux oxytropis TaxID=2970915 RepID=A0AA41XK53_9MICO|nr:2'-5' RNA ligase family protein [Herbiconiux oxytropis]MCS5722843.1 2'-5' RNA ligase family protein [Herbiconiux oxytropis]MCS5727773.1 2'-5' RNA ligase family protein [Herbiconiux oxytropis]
MTDAPRQPVVSLELLLDPVTEMRVMAEWEALAGAGLSSLAAHTAASNRPHITLLVRSGLTSPAPEALAAAIALPLPVELGAPLLFGAGDRRVLVRSVVPSPALLHLHSVVHDLAGPGDDAPHTRPAQWTPHVTLARRLRLDTLPQALRLLDDTAERAADAGAVASSGAADSGSSATALRRWDAASATVTHLL